MIVLKMLSLNVSNKFPQSMGRVNETIIHFSWLNGAWALENTQLKAITTSTFNNVEFLHQEVENYFKNEVKNKGRCYQILVASSFFCANVATAKATLKMLNAMMNCFILSPFLGHLSFFLAKLKKTQYLEGY